MNTWDCSDPQIPKHDKEAIFIFDNSYDLSYPQFMEIHPEAKLLFLSGKLPKFADSRCSALDFRDCVDDIRFQPGGYKFPSFKYITYTHEGLSDQHIENLVQSNGVIMAGPLAINSFWYIGNLMDRDVVSFLQSGTLVPIDTYLIPEAIHYQCEIKGGKYPQCPTYSHLVNVIHAKHFTIY